MILYRAQRAGSEGDIYLHQIHDTWLISHMHYTNAWRVPQRHVMYRECIVQNVGTNGQASFEM